MALSTYAGLCSAVGFWLHRADLASIVPDFVTLAETRINRILRVREMETETTLVSTGVAAIALPTNYMEAKRIYQTSDPKNDLQYMTPQDFYARYVSSTTGDPEVFTIEGENLLIGPAAASGTKFMINYYKKQSAISSTAHSLFTNNPDLYLFGALLEAQPYVKDDKRYPLWESRFQDALEQVQTKDNKDRHSGSILQVRTDSAIV